MEFKPTLNKPANQQSKGFEKNFNKTMSQYNVKLSETDDMLIEKDDSIKRHKLFNLERMETLVFADPMLSAQYNKLEKNADKYFGFHKNENIMSYIFNRYVITDSMNFQKYNNTPHPAKEKKGRGESGINQLKKAGEEKMGLTPEVDETTSAASSGSFAAPLKLNNVDETTTAGSAGGAAGYVGYAGPAAWSKTGKPMMNKPIWPSGTVIGESNYLTNPIEFENYVNIINEQMEIENPENSQKPNVKAYTDNSVNDKIINDTSAFTSDTVKKWDKSDTLLQNKTIDTGKMDGNVDNLDEESMFDPNPMTMAYKSDQSTMPKGLTNTGLKETKNIENMELFEQLENELESYSIHHNKLMKMVEDRKPSAIVLRDRVGSENEKNFKKDLQHSGTKEIINVEKELQWKDQQTDVKNPQKLTADIEKKEMQVTKGEGFDNVGDSANDNGNEIPKRNFTDVEQKEIDMYRLGMQDLVYDNDPGKKFNDRMKNDMGEKLYKQREDKLAFRSKAPMYNKDTSPTEKGNEKNQYNKFDIKESTISGKFIDILGKRKLIDFNLVESLNETNLDVENLFEIDFTGLGNAYSNKGDINETIVNVISDHKFYTDGQKVIAVKSVKSLNESVANEKQPINEEYNKMQHLLKYKPNTYINTKNVKSNRGF